MSIRVPLSGIPPDVQKQIVDELVVESKSSFGSYGKEVQIFPFETDGDHGIIPFAYGTQKLRQFPNDKIAFSKHPEMVNVGVLRDYQTGVVAEAFDCLKKFRCVFLWMATGKGKTRTSIHMGLTLKLKMCVLLFRDVLFKQWNDSLRQCYPNIRIQRVDSKSPMDPTAHVYLINPLTVLKRARSDFADIGTLIVDEATFLCSEKMSRSFLWFSPRYVIGLCASATRSDSLDKLLDLHFGTRHIRVPLWVEHNYYKFETGLKPVVKLNAQGRTDWDSMLKYQACEPWRNEMIIRVCQFFPTRFPLLLCKRRIHSKFLCERLTELGESVDYTDGTRKKYNEDCRILITTYSKSGIGFDDPKRDMIVVCSDVQENFDQYFGRGCRREDSEPIVVDFVDNYKSLQTHFGTRFKYAKSVGGTQRDFRKSFPEFFEPVEIRFEPAE